MDLSSVAAGLEDIRCWLRDIQCSMSEPSSRRERVAIAVFAALCVQGQHGNIGPGSKNAFARWAVEYADALIAELDHSNAGSSGLMNELRGILVDMLERADVANEAAGEYEPAPFSPALLARAQDALRLLAELDRQKGD